MELNVIGAKPMSVSASVFNRDFNEGLVHQVLVAYRNAGRAGTKAQKTRSERHGTTRKSKPQKGGGARHGALTAPIFVGGGLTFAAKPRSFGEKVNRRMYRAAMAAIISELNRSERLKVVDTFTIDAPKTSAMVAKLAEMELSGRIILVAESAPQELYLAARNLPYVHVVDVAALDPASLIGASHVVMTVDSVKRIEEWLA